MSCTGAGEYFIRIGFAHEIAARVRFSGASLTESVDEAIAEIVALGGTGGTIVVAPTGEAVWRFSTPGMFRGRAAASGERVVAIYGDEP